MPLYEYVAREDGTKVELLRSMGEADAPVPDPEGKGRTFVRVHSTFASGSAEGGGSLPMGGCCPCGKNAGACSRN